MPLKLEFEHNQSIIIKETQTFNENPKADKYSVKKADAVCDICSWMEPHCLVNSPVCKDLLYYAKTWSSPASGQNVSHHPESRVQESAAKKLVHGRLCNKWLPSVQQKKEKKLEKRWWRKAQLEVLYNWLVGRIKSRVQSDMHRVSACVCVYTISFN